MAEKPLHHATIRLYGAEEAFIIAGTFTISRGARTEARVVTVTAQAGGVTGRGECVPYARYGESADSVLAQIAATNRNAAADGLDRHSLRMMLPAGAARNAIDGALWDLDAKTLGRRAWQIAGLAEPGPVVTAYTLSLDTPAEMAANAAKHANRDLLKLKLGGSGDLDRVRAVVDAAPRSQIIVDANEAWDRADWDALVPAFSDLGIAMIEQPFKAGEDALLADLDRPVPVCADESFHVAADAVGLSDRYDVLNVKLDKAGGLTEALDAVATARAWDMKVMVGCMIGTSLAMAPAVLAAQGAEIVDLDGPLILAEDRDPPLCYDGSTVHPPDPELWG